MLTSRGVTRLSRRAVSGVTRTSLISTSAPVLARAALSASAGTHSSLRPTRFATSTSGTSFFHQFVEHYTLRSVFSCPLLFSPQRPH